MTAQQLAEAPHVGTVLHNGYVTRPVPKHDGKIASIYDWVGLDDRPRPEP
jgi:hypothetical protein